MFTFIIKIIRKSRILKTGIILSLFYVPHISLYAQGSTSDIFENLLISNTSEGQLVQIKLSLPFNHISHFPISRGRYVSIKLSPIQKSALDDYPLSQVAVLSPAKNENTSLVDVSYEKDDDGNLLLELKFKGTLDYKIKQQDDKTIGIFIPRINQSKKAVPTKETSGKYWAINLQSTLQDKKPSSLSKIKNIDKYKIYTAKVIIGGKTWHRLRFGFFTRKDEAFKVKQSLLKIFPSAWVTLIKDNEVRLAEEWLIDNDRRQDNIALTTAPLQPPKVSYPERAAFVPTKGGRSEKLMEIARQALIDNQYKKAINYYSKVIGLNEKSTRQDALEFLGVAREKNNQLAHAKAEYKKYLRLYPDSAGASRVRQRLQAILTSRKAPKKKLAKNGKKSGGEWNFHGSLSQFYRRQDISTDNIGTINTDDSLNTDVALTGRYRGSDYDMRAQITSNHRYDFNEPIDPEKSSVYSSYLDISPTNFDLSGRAGRQTHNGDGVLGRFDGLLLRYRINNDWKVKALAGYPVELTTSNIANRDKPFYGLSVDAASLIENWKFTFYGIEQTSRDITDRRAVGIESQYREKNKSIYTNLDYDVSYKTLNALTLVGSLRFENQSSVNLHADYRNSPFITTNNALIGQPAADLKELLTSFTEEQIRDLARDRTARFKSLTLSGSMPLNDKYQINGDISVSNLSSTPTSGGVEGSPSTGNEVYLSTQLIANNFFSDKDTTIFGLRFGDAATSDSSTFTLSSRFSPNSKWRIYPRISVDKRKSTSGVNKTTYKPLIKFDYRYTRNMKLRMELGYDAATIQLPGSTEKEDVRFIYVGYIYNF